MQMNFASYLLPLYAFISDDNENLGVNLASQTQTILQL
jgi:hypothetical protein